jgi:plasmid replication initiation protein
MLIKKTQELVVQSNKLVEAHYRLTLQEKRLVLWLISLIHKDDIDFKKYQLKIIDFAQMMGLNPKTQYKEMKLVTKSLITRAIEIEELETGSVKQMAWLAFAHWELRKGICSINFHPELKPYLLQLKEQFTQIGFADLLGLSSVYSVRIFELLAQYEAIGNRKTSIEEIRKWCGIGKDEYEKYNDLKRKVINRAKTEINAKTGYEIDYQEIKESRKVIGLDWSIQKKTKKKNQREKAVIIEKELINTTIILEQLLEYGFTKQAGNRIIKKHEETDITNAIKAVDIYRAKHDVKNPKALVETAIKEKWHPERFQIKTTKKRS